MKYLISFITVLGLISCSGPRYITGTTSNIYNIIDSIRTVDMINIPDMTYWKSIDLYTNDSTIVHISTYYESIKRKSYILNVVETENAYHYNYRVE